MRPILLPTSLGSLLKKPPGEGTGPTIHVDFRRNLVGRVPSRGERDVFERAVRTGKASSFFSCVESELSGKLLAGLFPSVRLLCRPAPIHCQDTSGDKRVFQ